jgi:hypothetical protein
MMLNAKLHGEPRHMIPAPDMVPFRFLASAKDTSGIGFGAQAHFPPVTDEYSSLKSIAAASSKAASTLTFVTRR